MHTLPTVSAEYSIRTSPAAITEGMLGPIFVKPDTGDLFALTAAQAVYGAATVAVVDERGVQRIVSLSPPKLSFGSANWGEADEMIALLPLANHALIKRTRSSPSAQVTTATGGARIPSSVWRWLGTDVMIATSQGPKLGRLISVDGHFQMPRPSDGRVTIFDDALEIRAKSGEPLVGKGDAGALVTSLDGAWLGVVVAAEGATAFAAPIAATVLREGLAVPTDDQIDRHNTSFSRNAVTAMEAWLASSRAALHGAGRSFATGDAAADRPSVRGGEVLDIVAATEAADYFLGTEADGGR